jgi:ubiquinone/menaquinone biosynthesis C-methylase UbiE
VAVSPAPNPFAIFNAFNAYQTTQVLITAIELDVFTKIGEGANTVERLAAKTNSAERGIRILCDALTIVGFLRKSDHTYTLADEAAMFLDRRSPASLADAARFLHGQDILHGFARFTDAVRKGGTALPNEGTTAPNFAAWVDFARGMMPLAMPSAKGIAAILQATDGKPWKVLDIAAGHGIFGITIAQQNPSATIIALDWPAVLEVAKENANRFGVGSRFSTLPGSAFDVDFGTGYDVVLLTNFLHHFDKPTCTSLLSKVFAALNPGGRALTLEFVPNEDRISPPPAAWFSAIMLATTPRGDAYTFSELKRMHEAVGFRDISLHSLDPLPHSVVVGTRP